jgi:hypothetical protein
MAPTTPPIINPLLQILWMDSGDGGAAGAVAVAMSAMKKQGKKAPGGLETLKVSNNFGPAGRRNPPRAAKVDGGVREPEFAGRTPSPLKKARGKEASFLFCLDCKKASAAAKGGRNVEAKAITEDNSDDNKGASIIVGPDRKKVFAAAKGGRDIEAEATAKDDSDDDKGASVGRPRRETRAIKGGRGAVVVTGRPKAGQDLDDPADRAGNGLPKAGPAKVPPKSRGGATPRAAFSWRGVPIKIVNEDGSSGDVSLASEDEFACGEGATSTTRTKTLLPRHDFPLEAGPATKQGPWLQGSRAP